MEFMEMLDATFEFPEFCECISMDGIGFIFKMVKIDKVDRFDLNAI